MHLNLYNLHYNLLMKIIPDKSAMRRNQNFVFESLDENVSEINLKMKQPQAVVHNSTHRLLSNVDDARDEPKPKFEAYKIVVSVIIAASLSALLIYLIVANKNLQDSYNSINNSLADLRARVNNTNSSSNLQILYDSLSAKLAVINASLYNLTNSNNSNNSYVTNSSLQALQSDLTNVTASLALLKSYSFNNFSTMCGNWNSATFIKLNQSSCSGCYGNASNTQCSLCTGTNGSWYINVTQTGTNCTGCLISSGANGFCNSCPICNPLTLSIRCFSDSKYLAIGPTSCSNCTSTGCGLCTDMTNSSMTASNCQACSTVGNGTGWCFYCFTCNL